MLSLSLVIARARLRRTSHATTRLLYKFNSNVKTRNSEMNQFVLQNARAFSTTDDLRIKDEEKLDSEEEGGENSKRSKPLDGEMNAFERLLLHSQQFQLGEADDTDFATKDEENSASTRQSESSRPKNFSSNRRSSAVKLKSLRHRGNSRRQWQLGRKAESLVVSKETDEIDYETELENVWSEQELKQRKYHQALWRQTDRDHICENCGERGHRPRNCLLPRICSNCGTLGHTAQQCRHRRLPDSIDEFLLEEKAMQQKRTKNQKVRQKAAMAAKNPNLPRPQEVPTSEFSKRNESLRSELEAELDAYADKLEKMARQREKVAMQRKLDKQSV
ncbi:putative Zinc finger, CCHC-type [Plasmopara halstedii]